MAYANDMEGGFGQHATTVWLTVVAHNPRCSGDERP
jgi:hypothetical protein